MNKLITTVTFFTFLNSAAIAQEYQDCFFVNNNGQYINLTTQMCPETAIQKPAPVSNQENVENPPPPPSSSTETQRFVPSATQQPEAVSGDSNLDSNIPSSSDSNLDTNIPPSSSTTETQPSIPSIIPDSPRSFPTLPNSNSDQIQSNNSVFFTVPITQKLGGIPLVQVTFNGTQTFEMLLDTGATITTITSDMQQQLNLQTEQIVPVATAGGVIQSSISKVDSIQVGSLKINNLLVSSSPSLSLGLLGQNFYNNYDILIREKTIEFHERNSAKD